MDFFGEQTRARRKSRWLIFWFALAVLCIVLAVHFITVIALNLAPLFSGQIDTPIQWRVWETEFFLWTFLLVGGAIGLTSLYKIHQLGKQGGAFIATELGGRYIPRETADADERRLLNVVDEMSIAAGIPAPQVFLLDDEADLNAFAAGATPANSVVAVTRGLLDRLKRDQLQGVIGHEISHLVNGDARLNMRLIGVLHGILFLTLIGYIGVFFGRLIKASVSRQREYLADASAVQFTRNPEGISGALRQLAGFGSKIRHPNAEEASHLFFGNGTGASFWLDKLLATHPLIEHCIARIENIDALSGQALADGTAARASAETGLSCRRSWHVARGQDRMPVADAAEGFSALASRVWMPPTLATGGTLGARHERLARSRAAEGGKTSGTFGCHHGFAFHQERRKRG
ncbi:hypothetical protein FACS1894185_0670 [Betaproteobacteria bacterium]|nr:hypothetical protein FACS1894185_0670 [Betaproteobacteria bacterium]GHU14411.1 hypothetical protein FACS189441_3980 [Betaproteobacteria bacterium]